MEELSQQIALAIGVLQQGQRNGSMDPIDIQHVIDLLRTAASRQARQRYDQLWDDVGRYAVAVSRQGQAMEEYARGHLPEVARALGVSDRTVYRRLEGAGFATAEARVIAAMMEKDG